MAELNLNGEKEQGNEFFSLTTDTVVTHDVNEEFSLPDYVPEIRKLLYTKAGVLPESKYIGDDGTNSKLEFGGTVTYLLIYTDDDGNLCSLPLTSSYDAETTLMRHPTTVFIDTLVDSVNSRVNAPRKITIKTRLKSKIQGWELSKETEKIENKSTADELFIERNAKSIKSVSVKPISLGSVKFSDKLDMQGAENPRPIWCDANATVSDVRVQNNSVSVRGEVKIKCICEKNGEMMALTKTVPIAEEIEAEGVTFGDMARVCARCVSLAISNEQNDEAGQLFFDLTCEFEGEVLRNTDQLLTVDCYSTKYETEEKYKTVETYMGVKAQNSSFTISEGIKRKNKEMTKIIDIMWDPVLEKTEFKSGRAIINGKLNVAIIGEGEKKENEGPEYLFENYEVPFKYAFDTGALQNPIVKCDILMSEPSGRIEGDKIQVNGEIYLAISVLDKNRTEALDVSVLKKDKEIKKNAGCVRVYFPKEGDTLWEIAKKYHITMSALKEQNDLIDNTVTEVKSLII